jgi:hypothetical protein
MPSIRYHVQIKIQGGPDLRRRLQTDLGSCAAARRRGNSITFNLYTPGTVSMVFWDQTGTLPDPCFSESRQPTHQNSV